MDGKQIEMDVYLCNWPLNTRFGPVPVRVAVPPTLAAYAIHKIRALLMREKKVWSSCRKNNHNKSISKSWSLSGPHSIFFTDYYPLQSPPTNTPTKLYAWMERNGKEWMRWIYVLRYEYWMDVCLNIQFVTSSSLSSCTDFLSVKLRWSVTTTRKESNSWKNKSYFWRGKGGGGGGGGCMRRKGTKTTIIQEVGIHSPPREIPLELKGGHYRITVYCILEIGGQSLSRGCTLRPSPL